MTATRLNSASLDLRPLYYLVHVAECGSFSRAAATLSIAQPMLSRTVKRLEEGMGVQLLHRNGRGVSLTAAGEVLFAHAQSVLSTLWQAENEVAALRGVAVGLVSIALPPLLGGVLSADLVRRIGAEHPLVRLSLREGFSAETLEWLGSGVVDVGILYNPPQIATLITQHICDDCLCLVGAPGTLDVPGGDPFPAQRLVDVPLILPPAPHRLRALIDAAAQQAGIAPHVAVEVTGTGTMLELVERRVGFTVLPSILLRDGIASGRLVGWPIGEPRIATHLYAATSMQRPQTLATKAVLSSIVAIFQQNIRAGNLAEMT